MKTYCRHINPEDPATIVPFIWDCYDGHGNGTGKWSRNDYISFLAPFSPYSVRELRYIARCGIQKELLQPTVYAVAEEVARRIKARALELPPVRYENRQDKMNGKIRELGHESIMQQVMEHIASCCLEELLKVRFSPYQFASIKGKGQVAGAKTIKKAARKDCHAARYAQQHGAAWHRKYRYHVKADIRKCYPSMTAEPIMALLRRDIGKNKVLLWFIEELLKTHKHGFIIGSTLSKDLCNYALSYGYREIMGLNKTRRGKRVKLVTFALFFMDDMLLMGPDRRNLKMAIRKLEKYMKDNFGLEIKQNWHIKDWDREPIDMMGYKVYSDGRVSIRSRIFLRARRSFTKIKTEILTAARRALSYNGYFTHTNTSFVCAKLQVPTKTAAAKQTVSDHDRKEALRNHEYRKSILQRLSDAGIYPAAA